MNRRDFFKIGLIGVAGVIFGANKVLKGLNMYIGDLLEKMANGQQLNVTEIDQLKQWGNESQLLNEYVRGLQNGASDIYVKHIKANSGEFDVVPLGLASYVTLTNQSTVHSDWTDMSISTNPKVGSPVYFTWDTTAPTKIFPKGNFENKGVFVSGAVDFAGTSSVGVRAFSVSFYNSSNVLVSRNVLVESDAVTSNNTILPFAAVLIIPSNVNHIRIQTYQNSGGALDVESINVSLAIFL